MLKTILLVLFLVCMANCYAEQEHNASIVIRELDGIPPAWNDRLRIIISFLAGQVPEIGAYVSLLLNLFWPKSQADIWSLIKEQVEALVDAKILAFELQERQEDISGLQMTMSMYMQAYNGTEKGTFMSVLLSEANNLYAHLTMSQNNVSLIPLTTAVAVMHLMLLRERLDHGEVLYGHDNSIVWLQDLVNAKEMYSSYFATAYPIWYNWRNDQISTHTWKQTVCILCSSYGTAYDGITGEKLEYQSESISFEGQVAAVKTRMMNQAVADMAGSLTSVFFLHSFLPGQEANRTAEFIGGLETLTLGPYSTTTMGTSTSDSYSVQTQDHNSGIVKSILVREYNSIDGMQMSYSDGLGQFVGNSAGGVPHNVQAPDGAHIIGMRAQYNNGLMFSTEIFFSDGSTSGKLGGRGGWQGPTANGVVHPEYALAATGFTQGRGPSGTSGVNTIQMTFRYVGPDDSK